MEKPVKNPNDYSSVNINVGSDKMLTLGKLGTWVFSVLALLWKSKTTPK